MALRPYLLLAVLAALLCLSCATTPKMPDYDFLGQNIAHAPVKGAPEAPVTIVEFSDFQCFFCWMAESTVHRVLNQYPGKVRLLWQHFPLAMHRNAYIAAVASQIAHEQGLFWEYHDLLYSSQGQWAEQESAAAKRHFMDLAESLGMDRRYFAMRLAEPGSLGDQVEQDMALARKANIQGTPTFYVNGLELVGAQPYEKFAAAVEAALETAANPAARPAPAVAPAVEAPPASPPGPAPEPPPAPPAPGQDDQAAPDVPAAPPAS